ncbi:Peptidoglycan-N-acetylglucosamine deacetylase [Lachnellula suecica]|uniref:chitin deacetylase n=1 Tax=Lachnellula suecica TaxID=602035 RepID=A0A8T9CKZ8_9HELO|nr:Peptidoglycan-N-acetylglucosamine deacetylase [Lachnellula suecica]
MRLNPFRRIRRLGTSIFSRVQRPLQGHKPPRKQKHVKIDDEEQISDEDYFISSRPSLLAKMVKLVLLSLLAIFILLLLTAYTIYKPPSPLINFFQRRHPDVIFHLPLPASQRVVALTLDDAPSEYTPAILGLLKKHNATATFFIIGSQVVEHPSVIKEIHTQGHELGNHAWNDEPSLSLPPSELERQIKEVEALLPANRNRAKYFRPGSGFFNRKMVNMLKDMGYKVALGSIYPHDAQIKSPKWNTRHVLSMVKPGGVIIMHDRRGYSVEELRLVLEGLTRGGWKVVSLGELLKLHEEEVDKKGG